MAFSSKIQNLRAEPDPQDLGNLGAGRAVARTEPQRAVRGGVARDQAAADGPLHGLNGIAGDRVRIREGGEQVSRNGLAVVAVENGRDLLAGDGVLRGERRGGR